ncbi:transposase [Nonomuraea jabiensis]|uniref:transposase n=1 Tax=Nonomuraea jabiensis TaxID=882448 RepID=UPI0036BD5CB7
MLTAGQRGDSPQFATVIDGIRVARLSGGRPRTRPDRVLADKAYTSKANRIYLRRRGIKATIPSKADQDANRRTKGVEGRSATDPSSFMLNAERTLAAQSRGRQSRRCDAGAPLQ